MTVETKPQHTPGPWQSECSDSSNCGAPIEIRANGLLVATIRPWHGVYGPAKSAEFRDSNARLIAAAPELLETLKAARPFVTCGERGGEGHTNNCIFKRIDAVIAKAEGKTP